ncbi:MAG: glycosyltransferase family A protein [Candidatus Omnitrophica bacterium]|nr:glycosyltransferase family A protein [Candidatus Omnitrophota bacterium]MDD5080407.1 glycosyltransferase family A protein [Candidatus Omnitrophota bacterium]MDD5440707.1 glycosyltransferase family A protein [Candidatus Omnitrophota bacterium]
MHKPYFSIIIPAYNRQKYLKIAVESVLAQSFNDYELIIIDDASNDNTESYIKNISTIHHSINYIKNPKNLGISKSRNVGLKNAKGEFICFLDSDDRFRHDKLQITYNYIKEKTDIKIFHTKELWFKNGQYLEPKVYHENPNGYIFKNTVKLCCISPSTAAIHKSIFSDIGIFDENLPVCEDYDLWLRITARYSVALIPLYLTIKQGGLPDQMSQKFSCMDKFRIYALEKILASNTLNPDNYKIAVNELIKKCEIYIKGASKHNNYSDLDKYTKIITKYTYAN